MISFGYAAYECWLASDLPGEEEVRELLSAVWSELVAKFRDDADDDDKDDDHVAH